MKKSILVPILTIFVAAAVLFGVAAGLTGVASANAQTHKAICYLEENGDLEALPPPLQEAARLRTENPQASLAQLAEMCQPPVSKSGLSHRMKKLESLAEELRKRRAENG